MAAAFPNVARTGGVLKAQYTIKYLLVAIIFFVSGLTLPLRNLVSSLSATPLGKFAKADDDVVRLSSTVEQEIGSCTW